MTTMVYKHPGPHKQDGVSFEYLIVADDKVDEAMADGWARSAPEAKALHDKAQEPKVSDAPPTRAELEQKATELKLKFDGRTPDKKLAAMIAEAIK